MALGTIQTVMLVLGALVAGGLGTAAIGQIDRDASPSSPSSAHEHDGDGDHHAGMDMEAPMPGHHHGGSVLDPVDFDPDSPPDLSHEDPFPIETGHRPSLDEAKEFSHKYSKFVAKGNEGIDKLRAEGYLTGDGTSSDPYVLDKFYVTGELSITSINRSVILRDGYVGGQLKLNYIGESLYVHHVYAKDLRVNENVKRTGPNTGGLFHDNQFAFVGQIRHFVGEFRDNEIGPRPRDAIQEYLGDTGVVRVAAGVVFNFDGFHDADVHDNRFVGQVDIKLHGHNHGDCFTCAVHNHADPDDKGHENHTIPANDLGFETIHSVRYASLAFHDNEIRVPAGWALRYNDRNHAGDDRTANSEPNQRLEDNHIHFQDVTIAKNRLVGGYLFVDVYNAADDHHPAQNRGILRIWDNALTVGYDQPGPTQQKAAIVSGMQLQTADGVELRVRGNTIGFARLDSDEPGSQLTGVVSPKMELRGFSLVGFDAGNLTLERNVVEAGRYGVWAQKFTDTVHWRLVGNEFHTQEAWRGSDVKNPPEETP